MKKGAVDVAAITADDFADASSALILQATDAHPFPFGPAPDGMDPSDWERMTARRQQALARDPEDCARIMVEYAEANDDQDAWKFVCAALDWHLAHGKPPPLRLLRGINEAFARWRGGESIAVVFGEKAGPKRPGRRRSSWIKHEMARSDAVMMLVYTGQGMSGDAAARKVVELHERMSPAGATPVGRSPTSVKRAFRKFFKK